MSSWNLDNLLDPFAWLERAHGWLMPFPFWIKDVGKKGEYLARRHFHRRGYHLLQRNWRHGHGELDLIMARDRQLLFLEVKTRRPKKENTFHQVLSHEQEQRLKRLAALYQIRLGIDQAHSSFFLVRIHFLADGMVLKTARI